MNCAQYLAKRLEECNITDVFGIPGGVILPFIYELKNSTNIQPHLLYNEQTAGFAACGYAQNKKALGCAYATRGPGISNMITAIAESYQESLPVLFITAHGKKNIPNMRMSYNQELDFVPLVSGFTKYAANIDSIENAADCINNAIYEATTGRKGPVFLDFSSEIFLQKIENVKSNKENDNRNSPETNKAVFAISKLLEQAKCPVFLIGDGLRNSIDNEKIKNWFKQSRIPILSSRGAQDIFAELDNYFGYIGSHGIRYANFILSKADVIIVLGNRLSFPIESKSFSPIVLEKKIVRVEIDKSEFLRELPNVQNFCADAISVIEELRKYKININKKWFDTCCYIKISLFTKDLSAPVIYLVNILKILKAKQVSYVCDVGNNEFFFTRAFEYVHPNGQVLCSKSFGTLGCGLGRAIGSYYSEHKTVICVIGDQGFQYNIQELQYISNWKLPIKIILMNNYASGMIKEHEEKLNKSLLHVTHETGYTVPSFKKLVKSYGIQYKCIKKAKFSIRRYLLSKNPCVIEYNYSDKIKLEPFLPKENKCEDLFPPLEVSIYNELEKL